MDYQDKEYRYSFVSNYIEGKYYYTVVRIKLARMIPYDIEMLRPPHDQKDADENGLFSKRDYAQAWLDRYAQMNGIAPAR
jgi:hypothetical protein